jgi:hypothetical protein
MQGFWPIFFLAVILKIPVGFMLYLVWWAMRQTPETEEAPDDGGHDFNRFRREPRRPRDPRRGPHAPDGAPLPDCPPGGRVRVVERPAVAVARETHRDAPSHAQ